MMMNKNELDSKRLEELLTHLNTIEIPDELDQVVAKAIKKGSASKERMITMKRWFRNTAATAAIVTISFTSAANLSPAFAQSLSDVPVLGSLVKVVSFRQFDYHEDTYDATLEAPIVEGLKNEDLQNSLNAKYLEENKKLYEKFQADVADMKSFEEGGHLGLDSGFEIKTNNDQILSIGHYVVNTVGSSSTTMTYDTLDKQNEILITLPSLFIDDSYITLISENIKAQMKERMAHDDNQVYWIDEFNQIDANQAFYITDQGKLMISFDK
ncbi:MAG: anti-sigma-V factor rsiV, partial [Candidatus Cellulosilyticum pullistercoris]|nr:anti-sigma-V factor rsiV [Candidatus Cellulosilyticum pullistercoris]